MPKQILPRDATIENLLNSLNKPRDYVQQVYENMWECKRANGNASVTIAITGEGRAPYYRIDYAKDGNRSFFAVYVGLGHRRRDDLGQFDLKLLGTGNWPDHLLKPDNWSSRAMSLEEVGALRAEIQKRRR